MSVFFHDERRSNKNISGKIGRIEMVRGQKSKMAADTIAPIKTLATWTRSRLGHVRARARARRDTHVLNRGVDFSSRKPETWPLVIMIASRTRRSWKPSGWRPPHNLLQLRRKPLRSPPCTFLTRNR